MYMYIFLIISSPYKGLVVCLGDGTIIPGPIKK